MSYTAECGAPGYTATVQLCFYGATTSGVVLRKYNPTSKTYTTVSDATLTHTAIGGQAVVEATYQITDGGPLDSDGTTSGIIVDPVGLAMTTVTSTSSSSSVGSPVDTGFNLALTTATSAVTIATALAVRLWPRKKLPVSNGN